MRLRILLLGTALLAASSPAFAQTLHVVDDDAPADFTTIQAAIDAAANGDRILIRAGQYAGFSIQAKALEIAAAVPGAAILTSSSTVTSLAVDQPVTLLGLASAPLEVPLALNSNAGPISIDTCSFTSSKPNSLNLGAAIYAEFCQALILSHCELKGLNQPNGGSGLSLLFSTAVAYDTRFVGGTSSSLLNGAHGARIVYDSELSAMGCTFIGGMAGNDDCLVGGAGAAIAGDGALLRALDCTFIGGTGCAVGPPVTQLAGGVFVSLSGVARRYDVTSPLVRNQPGTIELSGNTGDLVWSLRSSAPALVPLPLDTGLGTAVLAPGGYALSFLGSLGAGGSASIPVTLDPPALGPALVIYSQGVFLDPATLELVFGPASHSWILDPGL